METIEKIAADNNMGLELAGDVIFITYECAFELVEILFQQYNVHPDDEAGLAFILTH
jgi:hypothetical protein